MLRAAGNNHVTAIGERDHAQGVVQSLRGGDVAGNHGERAYVQLRRIESEHDGERVVGAGVGVDDDFFSGGKSGASCEQQDEEQSEAAKVCCQIHTWRRVEWKIEMEKRKQPLD